MGQAMATLISSRSTSDYSTVTNTSQQLANLAAGATYRLVSSIDTWVAVGANPTASAADNNHYLPAGRELHISAVAADDNVAVLRVGSSDGVCTLTLINGG